MSDIVDPQQLKPVCKSCEERRRRNLSTLQKLREDLEKWSNSKVKPTKD